MYSFTKRFISCLVAICVLCAIPIGSGAYAEDVPVQEPVVSEEEAAADSEQQEQQDEYAAEEAATPQTSEDTLEPPQVGEETPAPPQTAEETPAPPEYAGAAKSADKASPVQSNAQLQSLHDAYFAESKTLTGTVDISSAGESIGLWGDQLRAISANGKERIVVGAGVTQKHSAANETFYVMHGTKLYRLPTGAKTGRLIYESKKEMTHIFGNSELVFFSEAGTIKRLHIVSGIVDEVCKVQGTLIRIYAERTDKIVYAVDGGPVEDVDGTMLPYSARYYFHDMASNTTTPAPDDFGLLQITSGAETIMEYAGTKVNGQAIPWEKYPQGSAYHTIGRDGKTITCNHGAKCGGTIGDFVSGVCDCTVYASAYTTAIQCMGFAMEVYKYIWRQDFLGSDLVCLNEEGEPATNPVTDDWEKVPLGAYVRTESSTGRGGHSWVVVEKTKSTITLYEANYPNFCLVNFRKFDYTLNSGAMGILFYYTKPDATHTHKWSKTWKSDGQRHWKSCTVSKDCTARNSDGAHKLSGNYTVFSTMHSKKCSVCSLYVTNSHAYTQKYSKTDEKQHKAYCVCGKTIQKSHSMTVYSSANETSHRIKCAYCSYSKTAAHSIYIETRTSAYHQTACSRNCGYKKYISHKKVYTNAGTQHKSRCSVSGCGWSATESHGKYYAYANDAQHYNKCRQCTWKQTLPHIKTYSWSTKAHTWKCNICSTTINKPHGSWKTGAWTKVSTAYYCRKKAKSCGNSKCSYIEYEYDKSHSYPLFRKQCKECNYKRP